MARGRMLNKTISIDPEVAELVNDAGALAGIVYTWTIAHLDRDGRISGNPDVLRAQVAPLVAGVTPDIVRGMLAVAHRLGLITVYEVEGKTWVAYPKFEKNQVGMRYDREAASAIPEPSGLTPDLVRTLPAERKGKQEKGKESNSARAKSRTPAKITLAIPTKGTPDQFDVTEEMIKAWAESFPGINVTAEVRRARQWCIDNPTKRKTARGCRAFLGRWIGNANDNTRGRAPQPPSDFGRAAPSESFGNGDQSI